jgi:IclR family transcriptional regulator, mhp operon transcriptional activator
VKQLKPLVPIDLAASPAPSAVKSVDSLRRGLEVLYAIEQHSAVSLADLHRQLGYPKASLLRLLKTLREAGWVEREALEGRYVPAAAPGAVGAAPRWRAQLSALAAPQRAALQKRVPWPIDLAVREGSTMLILDSNRPVNGLSVNYRVLGFRPGMLVSSLGRCYMAYCPETERQDILAALARSTRAPDRRALRADTVRRMVAQVLAQGYATREPSATRPDSPERFGAISVPIFAGTQLLASLSCAWLPEVTSEREIVADYLQALQSTARAVGERVQAAGVVMFRTEAIKTR